MLLTGRAVRVTMRNKVGFVIKVVMSLFFSLLLSAIYSDMNLSQKAIQDRTGVLFFVVSTCHSQQPKEGSLSCSRHAHFVCPPRPSLLHAPPCWPPAVCPWLPLFRPSTR